MYAQFENIVYRASWHDAFSPKSLRVSFSTATPIHNSYIQRLRSYIVQPWK